MWFDGAAFLILVRRKRHATLAELKIKIRFPSLLSSASRGCLTR